MFFANIIEISKLNIIINLLKNIIGYKKLNFKILKLKILFNKIFKIKLGL